MQNQQDHVLQDHASTDVWSEIAGAFLAEFADMPDAAEFVRVTLRLLVAMALGGLLGYDRERRGSSAGLRTHMLVALGAALFMLVPLQAGMEIGDLSRVLQGVVAGIGFLGAGAIIKLNDSQEVLGLTTAASIWLTAAIGAAVGMGKLSTAVLCTVLALLVLSAMRRFAQRLSEDKEVDRPT
jgi:putative Mg2+ transporter-C (MgtC) family protein